MTQASPKPVAAAPSASSFSSFVAIGCGGLFLILALVAFFSYRTLTSFRSELLKYTSTTAQILPLSKLSDAGWKALQSRVDRFAAALEKNEIDQTLEVSPEEINALLQRHPAFLPIRGRLFLSIEKGKASGKISLPFDKLPGFQNRFLNADVSFDLQVKDKIRLTLASIAVEERVENKPVKKPLPDHLLAGLGKIDLMAALYSHPKTSKLLQSLVKVEVKQASLLLTSGLPASQKLQVSAPPSLRRDVQKAVDTAPPTSRPLLPASAPSPR